MLAVITGGSGSGKSAYAESLCVAMHKAAGKPLELPMVYIATMYPYDKEAFKKIDRHKELRRTKHFEAVEQYTGLKNLSLYEVLSHSPEGCDLKEEDNITTVLLDCMSNLAANEVFMPEGSGENCVEEITKGIAAVKQQASDMVIVTNEIHSDGIEYHPDTMKYQRYLGEINQAAADLAEIVVEVVYGIPVVHKGDNLLKEIWNNG